MEDKKVNVDEQQRRNLQEYIFDLEEVQEKAAELSVVHEKLKQYQDLLLTVLRCTSLGIYLLRHQKFVWCNNAMTDILGWEEDDLIGKTFELFFPEAAEYVKMIDLIYTDFYQDGLITYEYDFVHKNGHRVPCLVTGRALNENDLSEGFVFSIMDFTERKRSQKALQEAYKELESRTAELISTNEQLNQEIAERKQAEAQLRQYREHLEKLVAERTAELTRTNRQLRAEIEERKRADTALRQSEEQYRGIFNSVADGIFIFDFEGKIIEANPAVCSIYGYTHEELTQLSGKEIVDPDHYYIFDKCKQQLQNCKRFHAESMDVRKDGSRFDVEVHATTFNFKGNPCLMAVIRDITERKRGEQALQESRELFSVFMDQLPAAVFIKDNNSRVKYCNSYMEEVLGVTAGEGQNPGHNLSPEITEAMLFNDQQTLMEGPLIVEEWFSDRKGTKHCYQTHKFPIRRQGKPILLGIIAIDITESKKLEEERLRIDKLESLGILASGIAHDFNNLLTAILGNITLAEQDSWLSETSLEVLKEAEKASIRAQALARQLLTFSKGGAPVKELVLLEETIKESANFVCRGSRVQCKFAFPDQLWPADVDKGQISQVFQNLVINAVHAMPTGKTIQIRGENVALTGDNDLPLDPGRYVKIDVQDQGIGIPADYLPKIFDPYFTTKQKGSGLGLATVYSIIKNHNGHITVESNLGEGATFSVYLPASEKELSHTSQADVALYKGSGKILVMDDEDAVRGVVGKMLSRLGYGAELARDGAELLAIFAAAQQSGQPFDAVILDLTIPGGMGGKEAIEYLKKLNPQIKAIVSSGYSDDPIMSDYKNYGFSGVIAKPYKFRELSKLLHELLNGKI